MTVVDRADVRTAFYQLLAVNVTAAQQVANGFVPDFGGVSPLVVVASSSVSRQRLSLRGSQPKVTLEIFTFTRATTGADDLIDATERQIAQVVEDNQGAARWSAIDYAGDTEVGFYEGLDGVEYRRERIALVFTAR